MQFSTLAPEEAQTQYTIAGTIRQTLPFPIKPLPAWVRELGWYTFSIPTCPTPVNPITIVKIQERIDGALTYLPEPHSYTLDEMDRCSGGCLMITPSRKRSRFPFTTPPSTSARYCRHEQMAHVFCKYFTCYKCGRSSDLFEQFELRENSEGIYTACLRCEGALTAAGFPGIEVCSTLPRWLGRVYDTEEANLLLKMFAYGKGFDK